MNPQDPFKALLITRDNIISVLKFSIKDLSERSLCQNTIDDCDSHAINFLTILEHVIYFCVKERSLGNGLMFSKKADQHPWKLFCKKCTQISNTAISTIKQLDKLVNDFARVRAVLRMGLMEKRLHEYFSLAFGDKNINSKFYSSHSFILSGDLPDIISQLDGLSVVDFSFDLKLNLNHPGFYPIDYSVYMQFSPSTQNETKWCNSCRENTDYYHWREKYELILTKTKMDAEQKSYLEDTILNRDSKIIALEKRNDLFSSEVKSLENSVTDLQIQLTLLHEQYSKEIDKLGGNSLALNVPSVKSVSGSRVDFFSARHPLANHFLRIDASIDGDLSKGCPYSSPLMQLAPSTFSEPFQDCYSKLSKMAASTGDLRSNVLSSSQSKDSLDMYQGKPVIGKQLLSNSTQQFYSPQNSTNRKFSSNDKPNRGDVVSVDPEKYPFDYPCRLLHLKCYEQRTRIKESQNLRKIMGQACRSPMIRAHQRCPQFVCLPKSQSHNLADNFSLAEMSLSFNHSNSYDDPFNHDRNNNVYHSPDDVSNYYHMSTTPAVEQLSEDNYFEVESSRVEIQIHVDRPVATMSNMGQLRPVPESIRQSPFVTAEVPENVEPLPQSRDNQSSADNFINGDRGSGRSRNPSEDH